MRPAASGQAGGGMAEDQANGKRIVGYHCGRLSEQPDAPVFLVEGVSS